MMRKRMLMMILIFLLAKIPPMLKFLLLSCPIFIKIPPNTQAPTPLVPNLTSNEADSDLPPGHPRPPSNCHPKKKVMVWLQSAADKEWTPSERKDIKEKFNPIEEYNPLQLPVNMSSNIYKALKSKATKRKYYLLNSRNVWFAVGPRAFGPVI